MTGLPATWTLCEIGNVLEPVEKTGKHEKDRVIWYVDISSIDNKSNRITAAKRMNLADAPSRARQKIRSGDVLFSTVRPYLRNIASVEQQFDGEIASTGFAVLRGAKGIERGYLFYKSISHDFVSALTGEQYGVSYPAVKEDQVKAQPLELPPTEEQRRIVERIEALFDEIDKGVESLHDAERAIELYRQSLLKSAFEGRLTADWRANNRDKLEDPDVLLACLREERYRSVLEDWERDVAAWTERAGTGRKPTKPKRPTDFTVDADVLAGDCGGIASQRRRFSLSSLGEVAGGLTKNQKRNALPLKAKYLRVANVYSNRLKLDEIKEIGVTEQELRKTRLVTGDLLFVEGNGSIEQIGRVAIWNGSVPDMTHQNHLIRFRTNGLLSPRFALYFMMSPVGRKLITDQASSTSGLHTLSISKVEGLPVPLCSPAEQTEIVRILDARLEAAEILDAEIDANFARADALRQSILKKAFGGELVPQDPDDEPAHALLARIRAGRRGDSTKKPRRRARHRASAPLPP